MVEKLIRGRIIEIIIVILFVLLSIPVWSGFQKRISEAHVETLDDYKLIFNWEEEDNTDKILVNNNYYLFKNYKIYLKVKNNIDDNKTMVSINGINYNLTEFKKKKSKNNNIYTLIQDNMYGGEKHYDIDVVFDKNNVKYSYVFEEI